MTLKQPAADEPWTTNRLTEELYLNLMGVRKGPIRKYQEHAENLMYRIPVYKPTPTFYVELVDLSYKIKQELHGLNDKSLDRVMKEAIGKIFENINERYFLLSVKKLLRWEIV
jgi:hypothetical protein